jgi:hypothetical protein
MCSLKIPVAVLDFIDRARRHCLWRGSDVNAKGKSMMPWPKATKPKTKGGLGIIDLRYQNDALLLKHLDKFYNKKDISWVNMIWNTHYSNGQIPHATGDRGSFWWKDLLHLCDKFRGIATCTMGDGSTVLFILMFGMITYYKTNCQDSSHLLRTKKSQWLLFSRSRYDKTLLPPSLRTGLPRVSGVATASARYSSEK